MYSKHFSPLESDPDIFSELMYRLGVDKALAFVDIYSLEEDNLHQIQRPVLAIIVIFPDDDATNPPLTGFLEVPEPQRQKDAVVWAKQTINNACGFYAILHAVCNGIARDFIGRFLTGYCIASL